MNAIVYFLSKNIYDRVCIFVIHKRMEAPPRIREDPGKTIFAHKPTRDKHDGGN